MARFIENTTRNYSPNFDVKKRKSRDIKFIILHYTGMKRENEAINRLTSFRSKVSCHYFIKNDGEILTMVPDLYIAWHAGLSKWKKYYSLNKNSIGIEVSNPGHNYNYKKFSKKQIYSILKLTKFLIKKYDIKQRNILGHSDIAPERKKDPGEKFPWEYLSKNNVGYWHNLKQTNLISKRKLKIHYPDKQKFIKNLLNFGFPNNKILSEKKYIKKLTIAFQRRFRQELINGIVDQECLFISKKII